MNQQTRDFFAFGPFRLDCQKRVLVRDGRPVPLAPKAAEILVMLVEHAGHLVDKAELMKRVWPDAFVEEGNLNKNIFFLRKTLAEWNGGQEYIETVPKRGYRFIAPVSAVTHAESVQHPQSTSHLSVAQSNWKLLTGILAVTLTVIVAVGFGVARWRLRNRGFNLEKMEITKLTQSGKAESVAISPDGRFVVYAQRDAHGLGLWIRQVATRSDVQILPSEPIEFEGLSFSPDGNYIYFVRSAKNLTDFRYLYTMPALGGPVRLLASDVDSPVSFSPDGRQFAYTRGVSGEFCEIRLANSDGSSNRLLATIPKAFPDRQPGAAWSPDGQTIAASFFLKGKQPGFVLKLVSIRDGSISEFYSNSYGIGRPLWLAEGKAILVPLRDRARRGQLWEVSFPQGQTHRLTNDLADYRLRIDATRNAETLAAIQTKTVSNLWVAPAADLSGGRQITFGEIPLLGVATAQGKILATGGDDELLIMNADGSQGTVVPKAQNGYYPAGCGRYFLFSSFQPGNPGLTRVDADGSNRTVLVAKELIMFPVCSPDSQTVYYVDWPSKIWRVPVEGGTPTEITTGLVASIDAQLSISPDGKLLAFMFEEFTPEPVGKLAVIPVDGSSPTKVLEVPGWTYERALLRWSPDGEGLQSLVTQDGVTNIWEQSLAGGKPRQLTKFTSGRIFDFNWSPDGKQLLLTRGDISSDVVLISNFR